MNQYGRVILELHDYCNRNCEWCIRNICNINSISYMSKETLFITLNEIYKNIHLFNLPLTFSLFRYNEPLYDIDNLLFVSSSIKEFFNSKNIDTFIYIHTNGDYLSENILSKLYCIDEIRVNDYDNLLFNNIMVLNKISNISKDIVLKKIKNIDNERDQVICKYKNLDIIFYKMSEKDLLKMSKGSSLKQYCNNIRNYMCDLKGKILVVECNGDVMECCEVYNKFKEHSRFIIGNIVDGIQSFVNKYNKINELNDKICKYCNMSSKSCEIIRKKYDS